MGHTTTLIDAGPGSSSATRPPRRRRGFFGKLAVGVLVVVAIVVAYVGITFFQVWSAAHADDPTKASAIVVLGAAQWNGRPSPVLQARLDHADELYRRGVAKTIVVVGGKQAGDRTTEGKAGYDYLRSKGVPDGALKVEVGGTDTYEELSATALILRNAKLGTDVVLVTDGYHAYRAAAIAGEAGMDAHVSPTPTEPSLGSLVRETGAVAIGRLIGFRRLSSVV